MWIVPIEFTPVFPSLSVVADIKNGTTYKFFFVQKKSDL